MTTPPAGQPPALSPTTPSSTPRRPALPWLLTAFLAVVVLVLGLLLALRPDGGAVAVSVEQRGFATPEEAIEFSTERIAEGDLAGALTAWAAQNQAESFDMVGMLKRMGGFQSTDPTLVPSGDDFFVPLGQLTRYGVAAQQYLRLTYSLLLPDVDANVFVPLDREDRSADEIAEALDSARLTSLRPDRIDRADGPEQYAEVFSTNAALVGADERREYVVLYEWEGDLYLGGVGVLRYGQDWQIDSLSGAIADIASGTLEPTTSAEYDELVADLSDE